MRMQLLRACALLVAAAGTAVAADKPKGKEKLTPPAIGGVAGGLVGSATGSPKTNSAATFTVTKPVGTWVRDVQLRGGMVRVRLTITDDRVTLKAELTDGNDVASVQFDADYAINKESCLFGVLDTFGTDLPLEGEAGKALTLSGQPFAVKFRADEKTLSVKEFKGFGVGIASSNHEQLDRLLVAMCGQYKAVDPTKPLPELKASEKTVTGNDPLIRQDQLLQQSGSRLDRVPLPTPRYLRHYPTYVAPDPARPREWDTMLDPTGEFGRRPVTAAGVGPVHVAAGELCANRPSAELVQAKAEEPAPLKLQPVPPPQCDPPTDAEVMAVFNARRQEKLGDKYAEFQDDLTIVKNLVKDKIEPVREYPVMGKAQLHRCHWECGVYYTNTTGGGRKPAVEVISLDSDCLRVVPAKDAVVPKRMPEK